MFECLVPCSLWEMGARTAVKRANNSQDLYSDATCQPAARTKVSEVMCRATPLPVPSIYFPRPIHRTRFLQLTTTMKEAITESQQQHLPPPHQVSPDPPEKDQNGSFQPDLLKKHTPDAFCLDDDSPHKDRAHHAHTPN